MCTPWVSISSSTLYRLISPEKQPPTNVLGYIGLVSIHSTELSLPPHSAIV